jgi:hypothetical protein
MNLGTTAIYDLQERRASSQADAIRKLIGENERQSKPRYKVYDFVFMGSGPHRSFTQQWLEDVWSAQVVASWLTDWGIWKKTFPEQEGMVSAQGYSTQDVSPLRPQTNGQVILDLSRVLRPVYTIGDGIIQGPDGIYGPSTDSMMAEYARTGKAFGRQIPTSVKPVFDRILNSVRTRAIQEGLAQRQAGQTASRESAVAMESASVSGDAQINAGMEQTKPSNSLGQTWLTAINPRLNLKTLNADLMAKLSSQRDALINLDLSSLPSSRSTQPAREEPAKEEPAREEPAKEEVVPAEAEPAEDRAFYQQPWFLVGAPLLLLSAGVGFYLYKNREQA